MIGFTSFELNLLIILSWGLTKINKPGWLLAILFFFYWFKFDWFLLTNPAQAPLDPWERDQYFQQWSSGYGLKEIKDYLNHLPQDKQVLVATEGSFGTLPNGLQIFFNQSDHIQILGVGFPDKTVTPAMEQALKEGKKVYLVANYSRYNFSAAGRLSLIAGYPRLGGERLMFYEVH